MAKDPSTLRAPAESQPADSQSASNTAKTRSSLAGRCRDCGELLDVWNCCPRVSSDTARLSCSANSPLYCGKPTEKPWNFAVDVPGVGRVTMHGGPERAATLRGADGARGQFPAPLLDHLKSETLMQIAFAARNLAERNLTSYLAFGGALRYRCAECGEVSATPTRERGCHAGHCCTGRVYELLGELQAANAFEPKLNRKGDAPGHDRAGDGTRPRGDFGEPWNWAYESVLGDTRVFDCEGAVVARIDKQDRESGEWAERIVDCVNSCAGTDPRKGGAR